MIKTAITVSLVEEARGGPFVFWDGLEDAFTKAAALGFDAVEIFAPAADAVDDDELRGLCETHSLAVAAVGTGAGMVKHKLSLTDADEAKRAAACDFVRGIIDWGARFDAPAIIGSMQGRHGDGPGQVDDMEALGLLGEALEELGAYAETKGTVLIYEPLNRYETNLCNSIADGVDLLSGIDSPNVKLLADLFHMNIEEHDVAGALRYGGEHIGHVHFVDSNRFACGMGHTDFGPIAAALKDINYDGYISAEAIPVPDSETCAKATIDSYKALFA